MNKLTFTVACAVGALACLAAQTATSADVPENLAQLRPPVKASWQPGRTAGDNVGTNSFTLRLSPSQKRSSVSLAGPHFPAYCASGRVKISFRYASTIPDGKVSLILSYRRMEAPVTKDGVSNYFERLIPPSADEREISFVADVPPGDFWGSGSQIVAQGDTGTLVARDVSIVELPPETTRAKPVLVGGRRVTEIAVLATDDGARRIEEFRTARMIRYMLYLNGFDYLRVRTVTGLADVGPCAILVGAAAERAGLFGPSDPKSVRGLTGAGVYRAKGTRLGITGTLPTGIAYGAFACLRDLGIEYLGGTQWRRPAAIAVDDGFGAARTPAIPFRHDNGRMGQMIEMRGRASFTRTHADYSAGRLSGSCPVDHSLPVAIVSAAEFAKSHPEFFAKRADGTPTVTEKTDPWVVQYCMTDPGFQKVVADRILEMMRLNPSAVFFPLMPGDGGGNDCKCPRCKALGSTTDTFVALANAVAQVTKREFPDKLIETHAYVDTPEPPTRVVPDPNFCVWYCIYPTDYWPNCMVLDDPANAKGRQAMEAWWKAMPRRTGLCYYPMQCGEWMNLWPSYDSDVAIVREFAERREISARYFGLWPVHGTAISQAGAFADLRIHVLGRIEEDPTADHLALSLAFIRDFYGPAERLMREYFDIMRGEAKRRGWVQNCEQHLKGFVSKELAARVLPVLDAAEAAAKDDPARLVAVRHEKIIFLWTYLTDVCRGRGNVSTAEFPAWAKRYGEFCRLCRDTRVYYMGGCVKTWFYDTAFLKLNFGAPDLLDDDWTKCNVIKAVIDDPEKALGADCPNFQKATSAGIEIPAKGMCGAIFEKPAVGKSGERCEVRTLRRETSGLGLAFTRLTLTEAPKGPVKLRVRGIDNDHAPIARMEIAVNGRVICHGKVPWGKERWEESEYALPDGLLHAGDNDIVIRNITPDDEKDGACGDRFVVPRNYFWGWFLIEKLVFVGVK